MPVIDTHTHIYPPKVAVKVLERFLRFPIAVFTDATADGLEQQMRDSKIDVSVLVSVATTPEQTNGINTFLTQFMDKNKFIPFAAIHPDNEQPAKLLAELKQQGFRGIKLHPIMQHFLPAEERMYPIYEAAMEQDLVIIFHAGAGMDYDAIRGSKVDFDALQNRYQYDKFVFAHLGGRDNFQSFPEFKSGWSGYIDTAYSLGLMPDEHAVALMRDFGTDRVLFGSDSPWTDTSVELDRLAKLGLSSAEYAQITYQNAAKLLNLEVTN